MDTVFIRGLQVPTIIGAYDWERLVKQILVFNIEMASDIQRAASKDNLDDALNYAAVGKRVTEFVSASEFQLVETVAYRLADLLVDEFKPSWLKLEVQKPRPLSGGHVVGVSVERGAQG
jgi:7,8-dihydroneopterin aldolase/epimerase/oxygenase